MSSEPSPAARVCAVRDDALGADDAVALRRRLAAREVSPAELMQAALERTHAVNGRLNAVAAWPDEPIPGGPGPFAGIPTFVKDNEDLAGVPTRQGSRAVGEQPATASSPFVAQLLALGFAVAAKTTLPEFGLTATTESELHGATRNPWDPSRSAGGSSGGSAALVAAGVVPIAHANDGGGSIRIPAACCGLVGLKPTRGRLVDMPELDQLPVNVVTQGVVTRSVRDTAWYLAEAERAHASRRLPPIGLVDRPGTRRLRVGMYLTGHRGTPASADTTAAVRATGALLAELGHHVEEIEFPFQEQFGTDFLRYWCLLAFALKRGGGLLFGPDFDGRRTEGFTDELARLFARVAERVPFSVRRLRRFARDREDLYERHDVVLSPVLGHEPPPIGYLGPQVDPHTHLVRLLGYAGFTPMQNISGSPAVSLPLGRTATGFPIGVHLAAPFGAERRLLELALELEEAAPWPVVPAPDHPRGS